MVNLRNRIAAVTGAASGIGRMLAVSLADEGCNIAISDVNEAGLEETAGMIRDKGVKVTTHIVDVSDREQVLGYAEDVVKQHGSVHLLINNAGVVVSETIEDVGYEDFEWIMGINLWGVIYGCKAFLPYLKEAGEAHIVNISSVNGIFTNPTNGPYCTTKFAVRGFTETLCQELRNTRVRVSCVHPGGIKTNIVRNARFYKAAVERLNHEQTSQAFEKYVAFTTAEKAAQKIIAGIKKDKHRIMVGPDAYIYDWLKRLFPVGLQKLVVSLNERPRLIKGARRGA
ncbi:MAG TPA: SDR family oxidoreductase [Deltaproteobacteria bacterium]|nr:SDR family oxidoreductase [Deltaproteobacteria bacterium]HPJ93856.1 SDR family oxidoreductase [Deltaproteobacteria bacterium]HPR50184.1 SDR family oxidoreductase [Deltaproteobacteria bacterium]